jgi:predicted lactoylglutathione lyase
MQLLSVRRYAGANTLKSCHWRGVGGRASVAAVRPRVLTAYLFFASVSGDPLDIPETETTMRQMFVNLPVTDLDRAKEFYTAVGFTVNPLFTDHNAACVVVEEGHNAFMLLTREYFQTFSDRPIGDPATAVSVSTAVFLDSREDVDAAAEKGLVAGGVEERPASDYGFMYQRQLTDPDGNLLEFGWMDPTAAAQGPDAVATEQA